MREPPLLSGVFLAFLSNAQIEIFTTTLKAFDTSRPHYPAGTDQVEGRTVYRFPVDSIDLKTFIRLSSEMNYRELSLDEERIWMENNFSSCALLDALRSSDHDLYVFSPYLRATSYFGAQIHPRKSILIPALHDEPGLTWNCIRSGFPIWPDSSSTREPNKS